MTLHQRDRHEAVAATRARLTSEAGQRLYTQRQGVEGTVAQAVRAFGPRRARYRGLAKTSLQGMATTAAINLERIAAWLAGRSRPPAPRTSPRSPPHPDFANSARRFVVLLSSFQW